MVLGEAGEIVEFLRGAFPYYAVVVFLPILIILCPYNPVDGAHEFTVYRMQQYDLQGATYGCRSAVINMEARTLEAEHYGRRCVLARIVDLTPSKYREISSQGAGGLLILLPTNCSALSSDDRASITDLEQTMTEDETSLPVYFVWETPELTEMYEGIYGTNLGYSSSALKEIMQTVSANGFQLLVNSAQPKPISDAQIINIHGKLPGQGIEDQLPSIAIVAHYDASGIAPTLAYGADSNGSGVAAFMELARLFSLLYYNSKTRAKVNLLFLLSGGGKFNFQGTKRWIDDSLESTEGGTLQDAIYTICLDSLGASNELYLHVSKPPKDGSSGAILVDELKKAAGKLNPPIKFEMMHKKINLADEMLAWEHERFSIRRLPSFTLSHLTSPKQIPRNSLLDTLDSIDINQLHRKVTIIAEALQRIIYNATDKEIDVFKDSMKVNKEHLSAWVNYLSSHPRGLPLMVSTNKHPVIVALEQGMMKYVKDVKLTTLKADKRDPEFVLYDVTSAKMSAYSVKPAIFDLVLTFAVGAYLGLYYLAIQKFFLVPQLFKRFSVDVKMKQG